ncbi:MAG: bifunctional metallophosphatase/5-nucleotidase, partial [Glaciihabitans sp.]|nr:bifunctional metallophosphatase/5-nucleotidase [Glaciihabitans sp.]
MRLQRTGGGIAAACLGLTLLIPAAASAAPADPSSPAADPTQLTLLSTTDTHGHALNWDYFANAEYEGEDTLGLSRVATVVDEVREAKGAESVLVLDNGDAIQGTPLTYYYGL